MKALGKDYQRRPAARVALRVFLWPRVLLSIDLSGILNRYVAPGMPNTFRVLPTAVEPPLCTKEVASLLGCTAKYVRLLRKEGILRGWRYTDRDGSHWHYSRLEVQLIHRTAQG
jgi:hypothetical protein